MDSECSGTGFGFVISTIVQAEIPTVASFVPHYMTLVIAANTLQELSRLGKTHAGYTCVPKSDSECDVNFCYTAFNFHY
jgi:hypothetical protein